MIPELQQSPLAAENLSPEVGRNRKHKDRGLTALEAGDARFNKNRSKMANSVSASSARSPKRGYHLGRCLSSQDVRRGESHGCYRTSICQS